MMKQILITGINSYIGNAFYDYVQENYPERYGLTRISLRSETWRNDDWSGYDCILHVAGKAHADTSRLTEAEKQEYYDINCTLACEVAQKAEAAGVQQYIYLSSVIVYGDREHRITADTNPNPSSFYGESKWQAEQHLSEICGAMKLAVVRLPMVYGRGAKGNYRTLEKLAKTFPVFPSVKNERSMIYIENLAEFLCRLAESGQGGLFFPQNAEYVSTAELVQEIGRANGKKVHLCRWMNPLVRLAQKMQGKTGKMADKAFGTLTIDETQSHGMDGYQKYGLQESVARIGKQQKR